MEETNFASTGASRRQKSFGASIIIVVIFFFVLASWGGMKWYIKTLDEQLLQVQLQLDASLKDLKNDRIDRLVAVDNRLNLLKEQLDDTQRIELAVFFSKLEKLTLPEVSIQNYEIDIEKKSVKVIGLTNSFKYVAQQITQFKTDSFFTGVVAGDFKKDEAGIILFSFNAGF